MLTPFSAAGGSHLQLSLSLPYVNLREMQWLSVVLISLKGTFGPMASAFNICALVVHWRVEIPPGIGANESHGNDVRDPKW